MYGKSPLDKIDSGLNKVDKSHSDKSHPDHRGILNISYLHAQTKGHAKLKRYI